MKQVEVFNSNGEKAGEIILPEKYFEAELNENTVYYTIKAQQTNQRQGNAATKTRGMVAYSTKKPWKQKGTGRARAGMRNSPVWRHGGTMFGPAPKDYDERVPKKVRQSALRGAMSDKASDGQALKVIENLQFAEPKTRQIAELLGHLGAGEGRVLLLLGAYNELVWKSARNITRLTVKPFNECSVYDVLLADKVLIEKSVIEQLEQKNA